jgi:hypothetical protein
MLYSFVLHITMTADEFCRARCTAVLQEAARVSSFSPGLGDN